MKILLSILSIICGVALGLYVGLYLCFVGGALDIIKQIMNMWRGLEVAPLVIVWGVVRMMIAGTVSYLSCVIIVAPALTALRLARFGMKHSKMKRKQK